MSADDAASPAGQPLELRVRAFFPTVRDFERRENGDPIVGSLRGPERIEARQQIVRERLVAAAELKILRVLSLRAFARASTCARERVRMPCGSCRPRAKRESTLLAREAPSRARERTRRQET